MIDHKAILHKIRALREKTTSNGCTESEALSAAAMLSRLMAEHNIALAEIDMPAERSQIEYLATGRRVAHESTITLPSIAAYADVKIWKTKNGDFDTIRYAFFGAPEDVANALWLARVIKNAMDREVIAYKFRAKELKEKCGRRQTHAFLLDMARRIKERLRELKREQTKIEVSATGRDLVVTKMATVMVDFSKLNINLVNKKNNSRSNDDGAYNDGTMAGAGVSFNRPIEGGNGNVRKITG